MEPVHRVYTARVADSVAICNDEIEFFCSWCHVPEANLVLPYTKLVQCSRCQEALYCSPECKKAHFPSHRAICKRITSARVECLAKGDIACMHPTTEDERCRRNGGRSSKEQLADAIFLEGFHATDSVEHAARLYVKALSHYSDILQLGGCSFMPSANGAVVIKSGILLLALRCDDRALALLMDSLCIDTEGSSISSGQGPGDGCPSLADQHEKMFAHTSDGRNINKDPATVDAVRAEHERGTITESSHGVIHLVLILFAQLRRVVSSSSCPQHDSSAVVDDSGAATRILRPATARQPQKEQYRQIRSLLGYPNVRYAAWQLLSEEPLNSLFVVESQHDDHRQESFLPDEFFLLLRDCFAAQQPRGVGELLRTLMLLPTEELLVRTHLDR